MNNQDTLTDYLAFVAVCIIVGLLLCVDIFGGF